jgi:hypothetical protein
MAHQKKILDEVAAERCYQDAKWGGSIHDVTESEVNWIGYITEYAKGAGRSASYDFRKRMIKVAALAVAAVEAHDLKESQKS